MNFNSGAFLLFLPAVCGGYWILRGRARQIWLLLASYFFYMYANPSLIFLLLLSTAVDYSCSLGIEHFRESVAIPKVLLLTSVAVNLGLLFTFKYFDFFAQNVNTLCAIAGLSYRVPELGLILPVGISFYTFQTMSYTIDVYRRDFQAEHDLVVFALYVTYFPQLVAGPIESPRNLLPQLKVEHWFSGEDMAAGIRLLLCGFFRKCVVADLCGIFVNRVFGNLAAANGPAIAAAGALFCIQMYCDFAGYSLIAAGAARLMGVRLMRNFNQPYQSQSYGEFFRRWHISLNRWFTSYVYIPLGGSRRGLAVKIRNTVIVFALCGLWHGARWTYVLWGLYAAFFVSLESILAAPAARLVRALSLDLERPAVKTFRRCVMFLIFIPAALLFRAGSLADIGTILTELPKGWGAAGLETAAAVLQPERDTVLLLLLSLLVLSRMVHWEEFDLPPAITAAGVQRRAFSSVYLVLTVALCWLSMLSTQDAAGFAYFQF